MRFKKCFIKIWAQATAWWAVQEESYGFPYHFQIGKTDVERLALPIRNVLLRDEVVTKLGTHALE